MNRDFSLIDANIVRTKEGIRVLEDVCRFVLRNQNNFGELKILRHGLDEVGQYFGPAHLLLGRREKEIGSEEIVLDEYRRDSVWSLVRANSQRISESLRTLEEITKVYNKNLAYKLENYRYKIYELELKILMQTPHFWLNKYFEKGIIYPLSDSVEEIIWLAEHGAKVIQLRDKNSTQKEIYGKAKYLCEYFKKFNYKKEPVLLIINDDLEIASALPVAGVHLGQEDGIIGQARQRLGSSKIIGRSNHSIAQIKKSAEEGWDYLSIGPVYATPTKTDYEAVGLEVVKQVAEVINTPWLAIGGIDKNNINELKKLGAKNFAVVRSAKSFFN